MLEHLVSRGYVPGGGLLSPSGMFYLNIPKNASTYLTNLLEFNGWEHHNIITDGVDGITECIAVLRDPVDRWVSGFSTYAASWILGENYGSDHFHEDYTPLTERLIFDTIVFDDHTTEQVKFIEQLPSVKTTFFALNAELIINIEDLLGAPLNTDPDVNSNKSENNYDTKSIYNKMEFAIEQNPQLKIKLMDRYKADYDFIRNTPFYSKSRI